MALVGLEDVQGFNKAGRMDQALATLQKMVPENNAERAEIAFIMAQTLNMANRVQDAAAVIITAVNIAPDHFPYSNAAGYLLRKAKRTKEAETVLGHAASLENTPWEILNNLMLCYSDLNEHAKAKTISARCLDQERNAETLTSSGLVELRSGEYDKAEIYLKDAIDAQSDHADALFLLAELSQKKDPDDHETILAYMDRAIEAGGHKVPGHYQTKVDHLIRIERTDEALRLLETANYQCPRNALLLVRQIELLVKIGSFDRAMKLSNHALMQCGLDPDLLRMAASVKIQNGYPMDAMTNLQQALKARPKDASLYFMLGSCFLRMERFQDAFDCYLKVREFEPNNPRSFFAPAAVLLQSGEFEKGWAAYEARIEMDKFKSAISNIKHLLWQGESLDEKTLLVHTEQGFGDSFQFCRYLPVLRKHIGPKAHLVFLCEPETKRLMQSLDGPDEVLCYGDKSEVEYDYQVPLLSLPARLGTIRETIPNRIPYLSVNSAIEEETPYLSNIEGRKKVAVVWAGRPTHADDKYRSIPFEIFRELLDQEGVDFYPLQWGERAQDIVPMFETHNHIKDCRDGIKDFADTAARLLQMDLLITVDTSVAHLAGALGVPTWVMLPFGSEWRWLRVGDKSQWYPEMRLYRQHILADWLSVFARVKRDLSEFTNWDE